jgi:hypothetical protein
MQTKADTKLKVKSYLIYYIVMKDSLAQRVETFFATALVACHASFNIDGFRTRDIIFFIELFSNWIESALDDHSVRPQTVQVNRYLTKLVEEGLAKKIAKRKYPTFRLTRAGVIELLNRIVYRGYTAQREYFFFVFCFIVSYKQRLIDLARREGKTFPPAIQLELAEILNEQSLLEREMKAVKRELQKLDARILAAKEASELAKTMLAQKKSLQETISVVQGRYPYELNSAKPLSELMDSIQKDQRSWELIEGARYRSALLWQPTRSLLFEYRAQLVSLQTLSNEDIHRSGSD